MKIIVKSLIKGNRITKRSNGVNIFTSMVSKLKKTPDEIEFILDVNDINYIAPVVFQQIKVLMQSNLKGDFRLKLENSKPVINQSFNSVFAQ